MACLGKLGHHLVGVDVNEMKVNALKRGEAPISEPGLAELLVEANQQGRIDATTDVAAAVQESDVAIICVGTPSTKSGGINDSYLVNVVQEICEALLSANQPRKFTILVRSTCLPDVHQKLNSLISEATKDTSGMQVDYVCHPEFLREGTAIADFFEPPKIVFGIESEDVRSICEDLYPGIVAETVFVPVGVASMIKYADNCFHAAKVTFANEVGLLCKALSVDSQKVMEVFCKDTKLNISPKYLKPGAPFGGSCLPKDLRAMLDLSRHLAKSCPMLSGISNSNRSQIDSIVSDIVASGSRKVGIVGLAFKENTDDLRESPAVAIAEHLLGKGIALQIFDSYLSIENLIGANRSFALESIPHLASLLCGDIRAVFEASDVVLCFHQIPSDQWDEMKRLANVIDFTNRLDGANGIYW